MCENAKSSRSWNAGCGESYLSGVGSAGRKPTVERQQGAVLRLHLRFTELQAALVTLQTARGDMATPERPILFSDWTSPSTIEK